MAQTESVKPQPYKNRWHFAVKAALFLAGVMLLTVLFFPELRQRLPAWLSNSGLRQYGVFHWGVLGLCGLWLWLKKDRLLRAMRASRICLPFIIGGLAVTAAAVLVPRPDELLVFLTLLGWVGLFGIFFSRAVYLPLALLLVYGFSVAFPLLAARYLGDPAAGLTTWVITGAARLLGLDIVVHGTALGFTAAGGAAISAVVTPGCAGYITLGVFLSLFALMVLDVRLPLKTSAWLLALGLAGTWFQNIIRIGISLAAGYLWGPAALERTHANISFVIFPLWYALFAYLYLKQARRAAQPQLEVKHEN